MNHLEEALSSESMLDVALALWESGFHVIPLGDPFGDPPLHIVKRFGSEDEAKRQWPKTPRISWREFQDRPATEAEIRGWWSKWPQANAAILTGPQIFVVDADSDSVSEWCESGAITRSPMKVATGRGVQFYYRANDLDVRNMASAEKLDMRGRGGYVVAPGSTHANGQKYQLHLDPSYDVTDPSDLPELTAEDLNAIHSYAGEGSGAGEDGFLFDGRKVSLKASGDPVAEGGRNNAAASLAGQFIGKGHSLREVKALLDGWNEQCLPPLPTDELNHTLASIATTHAKKMPVLVEKEKLVPSAKSGPQVYTISELLDESRCPKKPEFWWNGPALFKGCRFLIAAEPKAGKSRFAFALSKALATGGEFLGAEVTRPLRVLYLNAEIHEAWLRERIEPMLRSMTESEIGLFKENMAVSGRLNLDILNPADNAKIREIMAYYRPDFVILDPVINFTTAAENDNTEIRAMLREYDQLGADFGCAIALVHHTAKNVNGKFSKGPFERIRGASALRGWYDTGVVLTPVEEGSSDVVVAYEMRNGAPLNAHGMQWSDERGDMVKMDFGDVVHPAPPPRDDQSADERRAEELCRRLLDFDRGKWVEKIRIAQAVDASESTRRRAFKKMEEDGANVGLGKCMRGGNEVWYCHLLDKDTGEINWDGLPDPVEGADDPEFCGRPREWGKK